MARPLPSCRRYVLAGLVVSAVVGAYYLPQVLRGRSLGEGEGVTYYLPMRVLVADAWRQGQWPLWNPYTYGGMPLLADCQAAAFYPPNLLYLWLAPVTAMNIIMLGSHILAAWGMVFLLRAHRVSPLAASAGAIAFVFSGFMIAHMGHVTIANAAVWLPWLCLVAHGWCTDGRRRWLVAGAVLWAMQFLAGHPQIVVYAGILVVMQIVALWRRGACSVWRGFGGLVLIGVIAIALCGVQIAPTLALSRQTGRDFSASMALFENYRFSLQYTPLLWAPYLLGTQAETPLHWTWWGDWNFVEQAGYVGLLPWMLLPAAMCLPGGRSRGGRAWAIIGGLHLLLAWNTDTPLGRLLFCVPIYNGFEAAGRHLLGLVLSLAMCTGIGLEALAESNRLRRLRWSRRGVWLVVIIVLAVLAGGLWGYEYAAVHFHYGLGLIDGRPAPASRPWMLAPWAWIVPIVATTLSAAALLCYARHGRWRGQLFVIAVLLLDVGAAGYLCAWRWRHDGTYRPTPPADDVARLLVASTVSQPTPRYILFGPWGNDYALNAQGNMLFRLASLNGYGPFQLRRFHAMVGHMHHDGIVADPGLLAPSRALDLWACRYVVVRARTDDPLPAALAVRSRYHPVAATDELQVYENLDALPHVRFTDEVVVLADDEAVLGVIHTGELPDGRLFDTARITLVTSEASRQQLAGEATTTAPVPMAWSLRWEAYEPNRLRIVVDSDSGGVLNLAEPWLAGWNAYLDGDTPVPIVRANYMLRAVRMPPGPHTLEMRYEPTAHRRGVVASGAGAAAWVALACWPRRRRFLVRQDAEA